MRALVLALLTANLLYGLWAVLRPISPPAELTVEPRFRESLVLLDEIQRPLLVIEERPERCMALGPFVSEPDARAFAEALLLDRPWRLDVEEQALPPLYRVYVPSPDAGAEGRTVLALVRDAIVRAGLDIDSYLVVGGDLDNAVSLGLFADQDNARNVHEQISGLGIGVEMQTDLRTRNLYSIVIAGDKDSDFIQETAVALQAFEAGAGITEKLCEMIALPD